MDDFLSKPFQRHELYAILSRLRDRATGRFPRVTGAPRPPTLAPPVEAPPVVDDKVLARIRALQRPGRPDVLRRVISMYLDGSPAQVSALVAAIERRDGAQAARLAHDLRGSSGNLGATGFAAVLATVERHGRQGQLDDLGAFAATLRAHHEQVLRALRDHLTSADTEEPAHAH